MEVGSTSPGKENEKSAAQGLPQVAASRAGLCNIKVKGHKLSKGDHAKTWMPIEEKIEQYNRMRAQLSELIKQVEELVIRLERYEPRPESKDSRKQN